MIPLFDLHVRDTQLDALIRKDINSLLDKAHYIGGDPVNLFARDFAAYCGGGGCVPVANGTDALVVALKALGIGPGDEVITVPFTFIATTEAIRMVGAKIVFVDVDAETFNLDSSQLERAITSQTKAIIAVHLFGQPSDMDSINTIAQKHGLKVIEDAAQAHGARYKNKPVGLLGDVSCFSFYPTKNLGAFGDAGAVVSHNDSLLRRVEQIANHGRSEHYKHEVDGVNSRMDAIQAVVLHHKLSKLEEANKRRSAIASRYNKIIAAKDSLTGPKIKEGCESVYHLYVMKSFSRDAFIKHMKSHEVSTGVYYPIPLHLQPVYSSLGFKKGDYPVSESLSEKVVSIPIFPSLNDSAVDHICSALESFNP